LGDDVYSLLDVSKPKHDGRLQAINEWWDTMSEEIRAAIFHTAEKGKAIHAVREGQRGKNGRKANKNK